MWEEWKIEPRDKVDPAVRHTRMACPQSPMFPDRSGVCTYFRWLLTRQPRLLRADIRQLNSSCRAVSQIATTAGCFSLRSTEIA